MLHAVIVTGGHEFDEQSFSHLFERSPQIRFTFAGQKDERELFEDISNWRFDVIVFYNMGHHISGECRENLLALLEDGVGVVALHHCIAGYPDWAEWAHIIGGKYFLEPEAFEGKQWPASSYRHEVLLQINVTDTRHPVTSGVKNFQILDETYTNLWIDSRAHVLLTGETEQGDSPLAWVKSYRHSRVCYLQPGHGPEAFQHALYRRLVMQAIRWAAL